MKLTLLFLIALFSLNSFAAALDADTIVSAQNKINKLGYEAALSQSSWPTPIVGLDQITTYNSDPWGE
ncbi:MAG: hypothetical protein IPM57_09565 [Oligoflexia bacterium]|nr:hypothetical protein [Oligoflexia bacterium]